MIEYYNVKTHLGAIMVSWLTNQVVIICSRVASGQTVDTYTHTAGVIEAHNLPLHLCLL